jgi:hypothetical protein
MSLVPTVPDHVWLANWRARQGQAPRKFVQPKLRAKLEQPVKTAPFKPVMVPPPVQRDWLLLPKDGPVAAYADEPVSKRVIRVICERYRVTEEALHQPCRAAKIAMIRHEVSYLLRAMTRLTLPQIAALMSRDHTTICHGIQQHMKRHNLPDPYQLNPSLASSLLYDGPNFWARQMQTGVDKSGARFSQDRLAG